MNKTTTKIRTCINADCTRDATPRYKECNPCRIERKKTTLIGQNKIVKPRIKNKRCSGRKDCTNPIYARNFCFDHFQQINEIMEDLQVTENSKNDLLGNPILTPSYLGGLFDGDGSILINQIDSGYQLLVELSQSVMNVLILIKEKYGGNIYLSRFAKSKFARTEFKYRVSGKQAFCLLLDLKRGTIIKRDRVINALKFIKYIDLIDKNVEKNELFEKSNELINQICIPVEYYEDLDDFYLAGIFDAEGCIGITPKKNRGGHKSCTYLSSDISKKLSSIVN